MADNFKILGQSLPNASTLTTLYTVPATAYATISSIAICNQDSINPALARISVAVTGASDNLAQYIYYDVPVPSNKTFVATMGITLSSSDVVRGQSNNGNMSFNVFGAEIS